MGQRQRIPIFEANQLITKSIQGHHQNLPVGNLQAKVDTHRTFQQRKDDVQKKSATFRDFALKEIRDLRTKLGTLRMTKFNEVMRENSNETDVLFDAFGDDADLARFLVLEGYLDDTYYQYTSLFHSGRLSPSDNKFLIHIRGFKTPEPDFQIDNPKEVIAAMRDEDFSRDYVLNVKIVDWLLADPSSYGTQTKRLLAFIASDFDHCEPFLASYYARGTAITALITGLTGSWPEFVATALNSPANLLHSAHIIRHLSDAQLHSLTEGNSALSDFVSERLADILAQGIDFPAERLKSMDVEAADLAAVEAYPGIIRVLVDEGLYVLSMDNLSFIFRVVLGIESPDRLREQNYTLVLETGSAPLIAKIDGRFAEYLQNVLLRLPDNCLESLSAIHRVIGRDDVEFEAIVHFLEKQSTPVPSLDQVPNSLHGKLFQIEKIEATWENCLAFLRSEKFDPETLTQFLKSAATLRALAARKVPDGDQAAPLCKFIIENDALSVEAYAVYVGALPRKFNAFPQQVSVEKTSILIEQSTISFSVGNLSHLNDHPALAVAFVVKNIAEFFELEDECALDDDFRQKLLEAHISDENRLKIVRKMDLSLLANISSRAAIVGGILARTGFKIADLGIDSARAIIVNSRPLANQVSLFNMLHEMFDDQQVGDIFRSLPDPFPDIKPGYATPKIAGNDANVAFVTWLQDRRFISSWRRGRIFDDDIRMNMFRK
jgi:hypothetical protein